jgi:hypothetical protein
MSRSLFLGVALVIAAPALASAQQAGQAPGKKPSKPAASATTVEIRGEVPTPQVVTVRPRQVPAYSRGILVPAFYDRHFWGAILEPYRIVPPLPTDTSHRPPMATGDSTNALPRGKT